jgi:hypothetical protein
VFGVGDDEALARQVDLGRVRAAVGSFGVSDAVRKAKVTSVANAGSDQRERTCRSAFCSDIGGLYESPRRR